MFESERYLKTIIESSMDGITVVDEQGKFEFANDSFFKISGWLKEEIIGEYFMKIIPEDARKFVKGHWQAVKMDHGGVHEIKIMTRYGEIKYLNVASSLVEINGENKVIAIVQDITEKIRLEKKLKESEEKFRDLFEYADDPMYTIDKLGFFTAINRSGLKILGGDNEEIIGSHISKWLTPDSLKASMDILAKQMSGELFEEAVLIEVITKDGTHKWGESKTRIMKDGDTITGIHGIVRDITEKKRLEQELKESESRYRELFDNAEDAMYVLDKDRIVLKMNKIGLEILGCTKEEVIGQSILKWLTPESIKIIEKRRSKRLAGEPLNNAELIEIVSNKGEHRWIEIKLRPIIENGEIIEIHGIGRDITETKKLKQKLNNSNRQRKLLCYLVKGTRGGETRALILKHISERPYNANQLANIMKMDYKTVRYHLDVLIKNNIIDMDKKGNASAIYFISGNVSGDLADLE